MRFEQSDLFLGFAGNSLTRFHKRKSGELFNVLQQFIQLNLTNYNIDKGKKLVPDVQDRLIAFTHTMDAPNGILMNQYNNGDDNYFCTIIVIAILNNVIKIK